VHLPGKDRHLRVGNATGGVEIAAQRPHLVSGAGKAVRRPVGQDGIMLVESGERRRNGPLPIVRIEESVEGGRDGGRGRYAGGGPGARREPLREWQRHPSTFPERALDSVDSFLPPRAVIEVAFVRAVV